MCVTPVFAQHQFFFDGLSWERGTAYSLDNHIISSYIQADQGKTPILS